MTKTQQISLMVLVKVAEGMTPTEALRAVCGADVVDAMLAEVMAARR